MNSSHRSHGYRDMSAQLSFTRVLLQGLEELLGIAERN